MLTDYRYVFVLTYGRSGSTLLMKILNGIEGYDIHGENYNTLFHLYRSIDAAGRAKAQRGASDSDAGTPWYGAPGIDAAGYASDAVEGFVANVLRPKPNSQVLGFKEIRNNNAIMNEAEFAGYVAFILAQFPNARIIFNTRNAEQVAASGWFKDKPKDVVLDRIGSADDWFSTASKTHPACFSIDYAQVCDNGARLGEMFAFLGETHDVDRVAGLLDVPLSHMKSAGSVSSKMKKLLGKARRN